MTGSTDDVELRIGSGLAGSQTVELVVSDSGAPELLAVLDAHEIGYDRLDKRVADLPGAVVLALGSFHLGPDGSGLGEALQDFRRRLEPTIAAVTIGSTPYELTESEAVASALVALRAVQEQEDQTADQARSQREHQYEMEQSGGDAEEPKD